MWPTCAKNTVKSTVSRNRRTPASRPQIGGRLLFAFLLLWLGALTACGNRPPAPTPYPADYLPTVIALTAEAQAAAAATTIPLSPSPTPTTAPTASPTPAVDLTAVFAALTPSPTPPPVGEPVRIVFPGMMSKVASPIQVRAYAEPGYRGAILVELIGEDGRLLTSRLLRYTDTLYQQVYIDPKIRFEIPTAGELARLQISTTDAYGRPIAQNSVHLLLLGMGESEVLPNLGPEPRLELKSPLPGSVALNGQVNVRGTFYPFNEKPLILELITPDGEVVGSRIISTENAWPLEVKTTIPYQVKNATQVRLIARQSDDKIPGTMYLFSFEIVLAP